MLLRVLAIVAAGAALFASAAHADIVKITFTGPSDTTSVELASNPTPDAVAAGLNFTMFSLPTIHDGTALLSDWAFYTASDGGGAFEYANNVYAGGPAIFTGTTSDPTFVLGTYTGLINYGTGPYDTISVSDVPEPASIAVIGAALIGLTATRRKRA
ncbi:MAG TPA: PEP-CTERM sorting domain-containing protein [Acetobacteraceae bacterium]|jgi:hypothetical protein